MSHKSILKIHLCAVKNNIITLPKIVGKNWFFKQTTLPSNLSHFYY